MQDKTEWKLNGQVLVFTLPLSDQACSLLTWPLPLLALLPSCFALSTAADLRGRSYETSDAPCAAALSAGEVVWLGGSGTGCTVRGEEA